MEEYGRRGWGGTGVVVWTVAEGEHTGGGEMYVCARDGMLYISIYYLSIAYIVSSCHVSPLLQEQGAGVVKAIKGCIVQCSIAILQ